MRLDGANRSFVALLGISFLALHLTAGAAACVLLSLLAYKVATGGLDALADAETAVWPAVVFLALVGTGVIVGVRSLALQVRASYELRRHVSAVEEAPSPKLSDSARRSHVGGRVQMLGSSERFSFAYGALSPRIAISRGLVDAAAADELDAILAHERYHVHNLDPLKVVLARALPKALFYMPALRHLRQRYIAGRELAADRRAVKTCGRRPLAGALVKVVDAPRWPEFGAAAAIGGPDLLDARIAQLETGAAAPPGAIPLRSLVISALGVALLGAAFVTAVISFGGVDAVMREMMPGQRMTAPDVLLAFSCLLPWVAGTWLAYRWLARRASAG